MSSPEQERPRIADKNVGAPMSGAPKNVGAPFKVLAPGVGGVRATVARKRATEGPLEPAEAAAEARIGSKGWYTRGYLPHYDKPGALQMVTFRLADAMPAARRHEWEALLKIEDDREQRTKLEAYLDLGRGECVLKSPRTAGAVEEVLLRFDGERYRLAAWVIMPNHVHVLVEVWTMALGELLKAWKGASARAVNLVLGSGGTLWQREYWDRRIRDEEHFRKTRHYIESNPVKAGLAQMAEQWAHSSANPKWRWSGPDRYYGAQLERGHSCRQADATAAGNADKNVGAPLHGGAREGGAA
jgi:REP element-mobilizing transposase RayT